MATLAEIRARLKAQEETSQGTGKKGFGDSAIYPHWNIPTDSTAALRFLEDADANNPYFWVERSMFRLAFPGVKASTAHNVPASSNQIIVQIPCMEMYNEKCAILDEVRLWFKSNDPQDQTLGKKYWKKRSYIFQGFVRENPIDDDVIPENPIRRFMISPQIFTLIKNSLMDPDIENLPTDYEKGLDFRVKKTSKGEYADYSSSGWARKETTLSEEELEAINKHGLYNLTDFLPAKPTAEVQAIMMQMFEDSVAGEAYDYDKYGAYFTPSGMNKLSGNFNKAPTTATNAAATEAVQKPVKATVTTVETATDTPVTESDEIPFEPTSETNEDATKSKAQDILAMIKSRQTT